MIVSESESILQAGISQIQMCFKVSLLGSFQTVGPVLEDSGSTDTGVRSVHCETDTGDLRGHRRINTPDFSILVS